MLPWCIDGHRTLSHENGDRAQSNPPYTGQHPLTPATSPCSPVVQCSGCTSTHTKQQKLKGRKKGEVKKKDIAGKKY